MQVQPLGQEDPLEKAMATHSSVLAWRIPGTGEPGGLLENHRTGFFFPNGLLSYPLLSSLAILVLSYLHFVPRFPGAFSRVYKQRQTQCLIT